MEGPWEAEELVRRGAAVLGRRPRWLRPLARRLIGRAPGGPRPPAARVAGWLLEDEAFRRAAATGTLTAAHGPRPPAVMAPSPGAWSVPELTTPGMLAGRLGVGPGRLDWLCDRRGLERRSPVGLRRYDDRWVPKRHGRARLVEAPRPLRERAQRRVLDGLLAAIPPHEAAHGFRPGRSIASNAAAHVGRAVVVRLDLRDFFPTIGAGRVAAVFRTAGYPDEVARLLAGLCTNAAPAGPMGGPGAPPSPTERSRMRQLYETPHLPRGAPSSPWLANLCGRRLDRRLVGLARSAGASYTRYADDLIFSGDDAFARRAARFAAHAAALAIEEGFAPNLRKLRIMRRGSRQLVAGVLVNDRPNAPRAEFDALKATLRNCARRGPAGEDRGGGGDFRAHLLGRIAHVAMLNPDRGRRLRALFDRIAW